MSTAPGLQATDFDALDDILDDLRTRHDETPQWEFCEGFLAALVCCRRRIPEDEWLPVLLGLDEGGSFADAAQRERFLALWTRRSAEVQQALDTEVQALDEDKAYAPEVMDVRGAIASLPPEEREEVAGEDIPSFAQVWALGFMYAIESWPEEWEAPKDKEAARWHDLSLQAIVALTEDDTDEATLSAFAEDGPLSVSEQRLQQVIKGETLGRNDPCSCGSGKKYKKCCGA